MSLLDIALLLMVAIWGANFSVIKFALREFSPIVFNALRLVLAASVFLVAIVVLHRRAAAGKRAPDPALTRAEWHRLVLLGVVGHLVYQLAFLTGIARTTASNSALIFGATPIAVALMSALGGHEHVPAGRWLGTAMSMLGIYIVIGQRASLSGSTLTGNALVLAGTLCWSVYSVVSQPLLKRHSPLVVTGYSMTIGATLFAIVAIPALAATNWGQISMASWVAMTVSSLLALSFAYIVWYTAVQRIGSSRTAIYSNLQPIVAMVVAALWLGEPIEGAQIAGAATIIGGVFVTRFAPGGSREAPIPPSES